MDYDYRIFELTDGTDIVDLAFITRSGGLAPRPGGGSTLTIVPHAWDERINDIEATTISERWQLVLKETDSDEMSRQVDRLLKLLRKAWRYHNHPREWTPVYLVQRAVGETNTRYALVHGSSDVMIQQAMFSQSFEVAKVIREFGVGITRDLWQSGVPGSLPSALTLSATNGPTGRSLVHVANYISDLTITHIFNFDATGPAWSGNLAGTAAFDIWSVGGAVPAAGDIHYVGSSINRAFHTVVWNITTAGDYTADVVVEYWDGGAWSALTYGDDYSIYPNGDEDELFKSTGDWVLNVKGPSDWTNTTINGQDALWVRLRLNTVTVWNTTPANGTVALYHQRSPHIGLPATALSGPIYPLLHMRYKTPAGGNGDPTFSSLSRVIAGARTAPGDFYSHINAINPGLTLAGWAHALGTDAGGAVRPEGPRGSAIHVDFATTDPLTNRDTLTGTAKLEDWRGVYRVFLRAQQTGGAAGDVSLMVRTLIDTATTTSTKYDSQIVEMKGVDQGMEIVDMLNGGVLNIPFSEIFDADDFANADLIFELHASRESGSAAELYLYDLILIPADEWMTELNDPISDSDDGTSALRGLNLLDDDAGVIANRCVKQLIDGSDIYVAEGWSRQGRPPAIEPELTARVYFLMMHYPDGGDWGDQPLIASCGMHFAFELRSRDRYYYLRGDT